MKELLLLFLATCAGFVAGKIEVKTSNWDAIHKFGPVYKVPGKFKVVDSDSAYHGCVGTVEGYPLLADDEIWRYFFSSLKCKKHSVGNLGFVLKESQLKRIGKLK